MRSIIAAESQAIAAIPYSTAYDKAIDLIVDHVHHRGGKLVTSGLGKAGHIALNIATTFSSTGTPAVFLHPIEAQHGDLGLLQPNDVMLLISNSGTTHEMIELLTVAQELYPGIPAIVITGNPDSELAKMANASLLTAPVPEVCPLGLTPTTSITMMTVIGDILITNVMRIIDFTKSKYAKRHHGGYLGTKARQ